MQVQREWLECVLKEDEAVRNVMRLGEVSSEPAVAAGENYASSISRVQLGAILGSGKEVKMSLILKQMPEDVTQADFLETHSYFKTEIKMYTEILPSMEEVLREHGIPPLWPGFLGQKDNVLIFSDLKNKNYKVQCRKSRLDLPHTLLAARTLAMFHSASVVLRERGQLRKDDLMPVYFARDSDETYRLMGGGLRMAAKHMLDEWGPEWTGIAKRLFKRSYTACSDMQKLREVDEKRLNVICHGDLWTPNLMFKYSRGVDTPIGVRFIDFQLCHYNSYAFDLIYFMACALPPELRRACKPQILESYCRTLTESLKFHGYEHLAPSLADVERELKRLELFNLLITISIMPICTATIQGAIDFEKLMSSDREEIPQRPEIYKGHFKEEVTPELLAWAEAGYL